jgi:hypothetical protein
MESRPTLDALLRTATLSGADFLAGGGEMGQRLRIHDWARTPLGEPAAWPQGLRTALRMMLASRQPVAIWWGPQLVNFYNDACRALIGANHPAALGQAAPLAWREVWDDIGARVEGAIRGNDASAERPVALLVERHGRVEEAHYTLAFTAMLADEGAVGGVLCTFNDVTQATVWDRQMNLLRHVTQHATGAQSAPDAAQRALEALAGGGADAPFAALYLADVARGVATLAASGNISVGHPAFPATLALDAESPWRLQDAMEARTGTCARVPLGESLYGSLPSGRWSMPPREAAMVRLDVAPVEGKVAILIVALNPFRILSDDHRRFIDLAAAQVAGALAHVQACRYIDLIDSRAEPSR